MHLRNWLMALVLVGLTALPHDAAAQKTSPDEAATFLNGLAQEAFAVLGSTTGNLDQRETKVRVLLRQYFDLPLIGRFVMGRAWRKASAEQKSEYQRIFAEYVLRTYSRRLGGYAGEKFTVVKAEPIGKKDAIVITEISRPSGPPLVAGWRIRTSDKGMRILDVMVQGISMAATQRSEFAALISRQGVDGLIETLRMQVTKFAARSS
jgi:phospholipid transport system substrate-binding protein